jgi:AcrR family transcriptional regulator
VSARTAVGRGPGRPPGPSQAAEVRARIIAEASRLYAAGGYAGLSFGPLAQRTGVTKATVFHYFPTKTELVYAIFDALGERLDERSLAWFGAPPRSHAARLERLIVELVGFYGRDPVNARLVCQGLLHVEHTGWPANARGDAPPVFLEFLRRFVAFVEHGIAAGEFRPDRPLATIMSIGGVVLFECMMPAEGRRLYAPRGTVTLEQRTQEMIAFIRRAVVRPDVRRIPARRSTR